MAAVREALREKAVRVQGAPTFRFAEVESRAEDFLRCPGRPDARLRSIARPGHDDEPKEAHEGA